MMYRITVSVIQTTRQSKYNHSLTFCIQRYVVMAIKPMHWLQIHPIVHN